MVGEYFDPHYPARVEGQRLGHIEGYQAGHSDGYRDGYAVGRREGWDEAVAACNVEMTKQLEFTRQHVERIAVLMAQADQLQDLLQKSLACLKDAETEQDRLRLVIVDEERHVSALGADHVWRYNKVMVCFNALRDATEEVLSSNTPARNSIHAALRSHYEAQVRKALDSGTIRMPIDQDENFAKALPKTHQFLLRMLSYREQPSASS